MVQAFNTTGVMGRVPARGVACRDRVCTPCHTDAVRVVSRPDGRGRSGATESRCVGPRSSRPLRTVTFHQGRFRRSNPSEARVDSNHIDRADRAHLGTRQPCADRAPSRGEFGGRMAALLRMGERVRGYRRRRSPRRRRGHFTHVVEANRRLAGCRCRAHRGVERRRHPPDGAQHATHRRPCRLAECTPRPHRTASCRGRAGSTASRRRRRGARRLDRGGSRQPARGASQPSRQGVRAKFGSVRGGPPDGRTTGRSTTSHAAERRSGPGSSAAKISAPCLRRRSWRKRSARSMCGPSC